MAAAPNYTAADFLGALNALKPRGRAWPRDPDAVQTKVLSGIAQSPARIAAAAAGLLVDAVPATATPDGMLPEWEEALGLPDPCQGPSPTTQARQGQVVAHLTAGGGDSAPFFIDYAATLGYEITISRNAPFRFGQSCFGSTFGAQGWMFVWTVHASASLGSSDRAVLQCELSAIAPAHTYVTFVYS